MDENPINPNDAPNPEAPIEPNEPIVESEAVEPEVTEPETTPVSEPISIPVTEPDSEPEPIAKPEPTPEPVAPEPIAEPFPEPEPTPAPEPMMTATPEPMQPMEQFPQKKKHTGVIIGIVIALLLIATGVVICIILLNSKPAENNNANKPTNQTVQPAENGSTGKDVDEEDLSTVSCTMSGNTWNYLAEITIDNNELEAKKIAYSFTLSDDYDPNSLTDEEQENLDTASTSLMQYEELTKNNGLTMAGVTYTSEGEAGTAGWSGKVVIERDKVEDEDILETFSNLDGKTAEEYKDSASEDGLVCTVK